MLQKARILRCIRRVLIAMCLVVFVECAWFNLPYFQSISASTDSVSAVNELGPGLQRTDQSMLEVVDPTQAYLVTQSDGSSPFWRVESTPSSQIDEVKAGPWSNKVVGTVHLKFESQGVMSSEQSVSPYASRSLYVKDNAHGTTKIWIVETKGALVPIQNIRANVHVPFTFDWARVLTMLVIALVIIAFLPSSFLWHSSLHVHSVRQRWALALALAPLALYTLWQVYWQIRYAAPLNFHSSGDYTYDFDQYGHVADALLHGRVWLDLPVPQELVQAHNPYDVVERNQLLEQGVSPIYWDYAFYQGHWYSYFGVIPAVMLFLPFQLISSWFVPGGIMLPTHSAQLLLMFGVAVISCLLVIRILQRTVGEVSLATVALSCIAYLIGANTMYLWFRTNFYSIPFASGLLLASLGLWLWLGARNNDGSLRWSYIAWGSLCIASTLGCRPTFTFTALLAIALFGKDILHYVQAHHRKNLIHLLVALLAPATLIVIPILAYNQIRFGSLLDFGNTYQITVTDMNSFHTPLANMPRTILYYLFLPLHCTNTFPFIGLSATPLPLWSFTEPSVAGLCVMMPLALAACAVPFMKRSLRALWPTLITTLCIAIGLLVFDAYVGGFGWRYMADFGWLIMLCAIPVVGLAMKRSRIARGLVVLCVAYAVVIAVLSCFTIGRDDSIIVNDPGFYHAVQSWFSLLP